MFRQAIYRVWPKIFKTYLIFEFPIQIVITKDFEKRLKLQEVNRGKGKVKLHPCTDTEALYRPYDP